MFKFTNVASLGANFALLNLLVVMRLKIDLDTNLVKHNLTFTKLDEKRKRWCWLASDEKGTLDLMVTRLCAIWGVNYHPSGDNRGRRRGVIWGSDWGLPRW